jgi:hypothetical protein
MELTVSSIALSFFLIFFIAKTLSLVRNYVICIRTGYPVYVSPAPSKNVLWMVLAPQFQPQLKKWLPGWLFDRLEVEIHGWEYRVKARMHAKLGKIFILVSPDEIILS